MKQSLSVILSLFLPLFLFSQSLFTVNVGTFVDAKSPQFDDIRSLGFVYAYEMSNGLSQVYLGGYDSKTAADKAAASVQQKGYRSAYVEERSMSQGQTVTVIQLATRETDKLIEWEQFEAIGTLFGILNDNFIKIVTGIYPNVETAQQALPGIKAAGFSDAFVKNVNNTLLIRINQFETGLKKPLIPINIDAQASTNAPGTSPSSYGDAAGQGRIITQPRSVEPTPVREIGPNIVRNNAATTSLPDIRSNVKRRSVLDLQKVLKAENAYSSSLDGYYGPGTQNGYELFKKNNRAYQKYLVLSEHFDPSVEAGSNSRLQEAINNLLDNPSAPLMVESSSEPIAKAYQAYLLFRTVGPGTDVNNLMNTAIQESYNSGRRLASQPPFDYNATYAYQNIDQLILHLYYLHAAPGNDVAAPCWLYQEHPKETAAAHTSFARFSSETFKLQACDQFTNWQEIRTLEVIAADLNVSGQIDEAKAGAYASARAQLFLAPRALEPQEVRSVESWNDQLWANLNNWSNSDPLHARITTALKVAYFQSQVRLEDYFMNKGFSQDDAKGLALATLKTIVGYPLERFA
jgi:peptidoglycan hydrolase-like protein with peptidoglycan-binding domain